MISISNGLEKSVRDWAVLRHVNQEEALSAVKDEIDRIYVSRLLHSGVSSQVPLVFVEARVGMTIYSQLVAFVNGCWMPV